MIAFLLARLPVLFHFFVGLLVASSCLLFFLLLEHIARNKNHKTRTPFKIHVLWPQMKSAWNVSCFGKHTQYTEQKTIRDREREREVTSNLIDICPDLTCSCSDSIRCIRCQWQLIRLFVYQKKWSIELNVYVYVVSIDSGCFIGFVVGISFFFFWCVEH